MPRLTALLLTLGTCLFASACGTTLSAEQEQRYDKLLEDRDNEKAWIGMVADERRLLRSKAGALEKKRGAAVGGALACGAWREAGVRMGKSPAGRGKGRTVMLAGGGSKSVAGGTCSTGKARLVK